MPKNLGIYKCADCGYTLEVIEIGKKGIICTGHSYASTCTVVDAKVECCEKPMQLLEPNTVEASSEKHLPVAEFDEDGVLEVRVGSVPHPMTKEHCIEWITVVYENSVQRVNIANEEIAEAFYAICEGVEEVDVYAYCNLHGLWKTSVKR